MNNDLSIVPNIAGKNVVHFVLGCAVGYLATRVVSWIQRDSREVYIDLITMQKVEKDQLLEYQVSRVSLAEFSKKIPYTELNNLRKSVGWGERTKEKWDKIIPESRYIVCAVKEDKGKIELVAAAFFLGNSRMGSVLDVAVQSGYQRRQIGTLIMNQMIKYIKAPGQDYAGINLTTSEDLVKFYAQFGFEKCVGMTAWGKDLHEGVNEGPTSLS